jgi:hypothetical protein
LRLEFILDVQLLLRIFLKFVQLISDNSKLLSSFGKFLTSYLEIGFFQSELDLFRLDDLRFLVIFVDCI